jgi:hypothetical protein
MRGMVVLMYCCAAVMLAVAEAREVARDDSRPSSTLSDVMPAETQVLEELALDRVLPAWVREAGGEFT